MRVQIRMHAAVALERVGVAGPHEQRLPRLDERGERRPAEDLAAEARRVHVVVAVQVDEQEAQLPPRLVQRFLVTGGQQPRTRLVNAVDPARRQCTSTRRSTSGVSTCISLLARGRGGRGRTPGTACCLRRSSARRTRR